MRKPAPPPEDELLRECLRGTLSKVQLAEVQLTSSAEIAVHRIQVSVQQNRSGLRAS